MEVHRIYRYCPKLYCRVGIFNDPNPRAICRCSHKLQNRPWTLSTPPLGTGGSHAAQGGDLKQRKIRENHLVCWRGSPSSSSASQRHYFSLLAAIQAKRIFE